MSKDSDKTDFSEVLRKVHSNMVAYAGSVRDIYHSTNGHGKRNVITHPVFIRHNMLQIKLVIIINVS